MCLYPKLIINRKYIPNKKNNYLPPELTDKRAQWVPVGCTKCMECRKQKARGWSVRLQEHLRTLTKRERGQQQHAHFVTLTFSQEALHELTNEIKGLTGYELDNEIATLGVRRFLERWRKEHKTSVTHWLVTELGHKGTEHIHLHGIIFTQQKDDIKKHWKYGYVYIGDYVNEKTVNYCVKYTTKTDPAHKEYNPKILTSPGIGRNYINRINAKLNKFNIHGKTDETYQFRTGTKANLPIYYRNQIYTDQERENLWLQKLDKKIRWVDGQKISIAKTEETYYKLLATAREKNKRLGYGDDEINWERRHYENARRELKHAERQKKFEQKQKQFANEIESVTFMET